MVNFSLLKNSKRYKDFSNFGILKCLYKRHKITKSTYSNAIRRLRQNEYLSILAKLPVENVSDGWRMPSELAEQIHRYMGIAQAYTRKCSERAIAKKHSSAYKRNIAITGENRLKYAVTLKKPIYDRIMSSMAMYGEELEEQNQEYNLILFNKVNAQFQKKLISDNEEISEEKMRRELEEKIKKQREE